MDKIKFTEYLLSIGIRKNGAEEIIKRFEENRADIYDICLYKRFKKEIRK